jgi:hypothetical protein
MFDELFYSISSIIIPVIAAVIYAVGYLKLKWEFLWIGFIGACFSSLSGFSSVYESINYDNPEMIDYLLESMWIVGWSLEVLCLYLIIKKVIDTQAQN